MAFGVFWRQLALRHQRLHIRMVCGAEHRRAAVEVVHPRIAHMHPVALPGRQHHERGNRAVRLLLGRDRGELDDRVRVLDDLRKQFLGRIFRRRKALEQLPRGHDDLVRRLAPATAATHSVGHHRQHATVNAWMRNHRNLVLLVLAVALVKARGGTESVMGGHERCENGSCGNVAADASTYYGRMQRSVCKCI
jgi:hypothetical protein